MPTPSSAAATPRLSVVIPAYNEASRIERTLDRTVAFLDGRGEPWEIVVADDGSRDHTAEIVGRYIASHGDAAVRLVALPENRGKGAALRAGVAATRGARVLLMDADLATPIEELAALGRALDEGYKVATGSRAVASSNVTRPQSAWRVLLGRAGNLWIRSLAVPGVHDTQCGFKLFEGGVARELFARCREDRFGIDIEVLCLARRKLGLKIAEVGVRWEHQEGSKVRWKDYLDVLVKTPRIVWHVFRS
ncbi:MAG TPA: dolichyl-phosphate beta-glucosyltransferase [Polyangia bacterium]|jgi:dolichyl-phosphate beta-glucosyltransferase